MTPYDASDSPPRRMGWPALAGAIRAGLVIGWWVAFLVGLAWSLA